MHKFNAKFFKNFINFSKKIKKKIQTWQPQPTRDRCGSGCNIITCSEIDRGTWLLGVGTKMLIFSPDNVALLCYLCFRLIILILLFVLNYIQWFGHLAGEK